MLSSGVVDPKGALLLVLDSLSSRLILPPFSGRQGPCEDDDNEQAEEKPMSESTKQRVTGSSLPPRQTTERVHNPRQQRRRRVSRAPHISATPAVVPLTRLRSMAYTTKEGPGFLSSLVFTNWNRMNPCK